MKLVTVNALLWFAAYFSTGLILLWGFTRCYMLITPYNEKSEIVKDHQAPAIAMAGAMLGYTIPLVTVSYLGVSYLDFLVWAVIAGMVQLALFKVLYKWLPGTIETNNTAAAILFAGAAVCVGLMNAFALIP